MNRIHIRHPATRSGHPWPGALSSSPPDPGIVQNPDTPADRAFPKAARGMMAWAGRCLWLAVRPVICAARMAHNEQVRMWECVLFPSGVVPLTAVGPLRWVRSLDGYRLVGSDLPAQDPAETGR
jgi:hypothetical protein